MVHLEFDVFKTIQKVFYRIVIPWLVNGNVSALRSFYEPPAWDLSIGSLYQHFWLKYIHLLIFPFSVFKLNPKNPIKKYFRGVSMLQNLDFYGEEIQILTTLRASDGFEAY